MEPIARNIRAAGGVLLALALAGGVALWWRLSDSQPAIADAALPPGAASASSAAPARSIRLVMSAAFVSESGISVYERIARYLTRKTGIRTEFVNGLAYGTINSMLESGTVECGFICGYPYVQLRDRPAPVAELIVAPIMKAPRYKGQPKYFSDLIVRNDSAYKTLQDLKGTTYVYNDEISNSGYNMPRFRLLQLGLTNGFFGKVVRSGSHEESIRMVAAGEADASFVDSLVLDYDREKGFGHAREVRVLESVGPAGVCPLVASTKTPPQIRNVLQAELAKMHEDTEGREILDEALIDKFAIVDDHNYDDIRAMKDAAEKAGFTVIR